MPEDTPIGLGEQSMSPPTSFAETMRLLGDLGGRVKDLEDMVEIHDKNLIRGFDSQNRSVVDRLLNHDREIKEMKDDIAGINGWGKKIVWLLLCLIITTIWGIILMLGKGVHLG